MEDVFIGIGSNVGDRLENLSWAAKRLLASPKVELIKGSSVYETEPVGMEEQPWFLNSVLWIKTEMAPMELLMRLLEIEREMGRVREVRFGPRPIDLDILVFGRLIVRDEALEIPHPRMHQRRFVLEPLAEIAPQLVHPAIGVTVVDLLARLDDSKKVFKVAPWER